MCCIVYLVVGKPLDTEGGSVSTVKSFSHHSGHCLRDPEPFTYSGRKLLKFIPGILNLLIVPRLVGHGGYTLHTVPYHVHDSLDSFRRNALILEPVCNFIQ